MDYVYAVLLLHSAGKEITKENMTNIAKATEGKADDAKIDMIIESLKGKNIIGGDVACLMPTKDNPNNITSMVAASIMFEIICLISVNLNKK